MTELFFPGKLAIQQRVLPTYRAAFFDALAAACSGGLSVFAGKPLPEENIVTIDRLQVAHFIQGANWHLGKPGQSFYRCWQPGLARWLDNWRPDALIVEANPRYLSTPRAVRQMHTHGRPVLGWGLGSPQMTGLFASLRRRSRISFLKSLDALIAYSWRGAREYCALGFPSERVFVAINAAIPRPNAPPPQRPERFSEQPNVLFVGRLQARKRIDHLLHACAALPGNLQPRLWIVGDGPARLELQALARDVYPQAEFPGARFGSDLDHYFAEADLFVLPGTGGLAVQQAMASGLPVVVAEGDGTQDDLVRIQNGWLVPRDNLPALVDTLRKALSDVTRLRRMGEESYRIVSEEANLESMVEAFIRALLSV